MARVRNRIETTYLLDQHDGRIRPTASDDPFDPPSLDNIRVAHRTLHLEPTPVFYAPLDGSRIDYHPCGRAYGHPAYIDPETGRPTDRAEWTARVIHLWPGDIRCGRCDQLFYGFDADGQYILHPCPGGLGPEIVDRVRRLQERFRSQTPEAVNEYMARRVRDGRDS